MARAFKNITKLFFHRSLIGNSACSKYIFGKIVMCVVLLSVIFTQLAFAQIDLVPIWRTPPSATTFKKQLPNARTNSGLASMPLPFWDDFSLNTAPVGINTNYPNDTLWEYSRRVWVNDDMGINPPSVFVATFDGYDSLGKPYAVNDILAKGFADRLTSRPLQLGKVAQNNRTSVFMSFFFQMQGNGESPDPGDVLYLYFKDNQGIWNIVWQVENDGTLDKTKFVEVKIPITDSKYFHDQFQFRFQNFGRLSGPYDTWNIDYVYVSNGKTQYAPVYQDFPDRTIVSGLTALFKDFQSMPLKHFRLSPSAYLQNPTVVLSNRRKDQGNTSGQPIKISSSAVISTWKNKTVTNTKVALSSQDNLGSLLVYGQLTQSPLKTLPSQFSNFDASLDSVKATITFNLDSSDNVIKKNLKGDWDTTAYKRIKFKYNDTTKTIYTFSNYYAYDDGSAEYGAKVNGIGTQLAYEFNLKTSAADTLIAIDYCSPPFGDESAQSVQFHVLRGITGQDGDYLYRRNSTIKRSPNSKFVRETLASPVVVQGKFYIGWKLLTSAIIPLGLDRSFDSGDKMFVNTDGVWVQNTSLKGSLMIRPVFIGKGQASGITTGLEPESSTILYPNPNDGTFYLSGATTQVSVFDVTGRVAVVSIEEEEGQKKISILSPLAGIYFVRYFLEKWETKKVVVAR